MVLDKINKVGDIKKLSSKELNILANDIRQFLIQGISQTGGHLASNLGVVELTMALHLAFDLPKDKIIWDVGHQSYTHKLLTGRKAGFEELRKYGGMSGFPKRKESECDAFDTGHSSTSISAGLGLAHARQIAGEDNYVVSVIGDGALTGGMAYEALNNASHLNSNFIIVLNDNDMSISQNVGGVSRYLGSLRTDPTYNTLKEDVSNTLSKIPKVGKKIVKSISSTKESIKSLVIPGMFFENMGITYLGPVDGHNINQLRRVFAEAKKMNHAVLVHVHTKKGKGYVPAMKEPERFHGVEPFFVETGLPKKKKEAKTNTDIFSETICELAKNNEKIVAITAAMPVGTGLKTFANLYPKRFFDVGIAEEHGVTFAAGLAAGGMKPFVAIYSSFLQRAYDQIIHDVCIQNLPVVFAIDRAGLVGSDGETHQGIFDLTFLSSIPNLSVLAPKNQYELIESLKFAESYDYPIAIRYPRGVASSVLKEYYQPIELGKSEWIRSSVNNELAGAEKKPAIALLAVGSMVEIAVEVEEQLNKLGYGCTLINMRFVQPLDVECINQLLKEHDLLVTMEENIIAGGFGERVSSYVTEQGSDRKVIHIGIPNVYVEHGNVDLLKREVGLDKTSIVEKILKNLS